MARLEPSIHPCLTEEVIQALHTKHILTVSDFVKTEVHQLTNIARITFKEVLAVKKYLLQEYSAKAISGYDCYKNSLDNTAIISTGIKGVDKLLGGGFFTGNIYEICGLPASGKTHFALSVAKNIITTMQQSVLYYDLKNDFSGIKLKRMLKKVPEEEALRCLDKVLVYRSYTIYELIRSLEEVKKKLEEEEMRLRLIIIDSLPSVVLSVDDTVKKNAILNLLANIMRCMTSELHVCFLIINLIINWNDGEFQTGILTEKTACGKYWKSVPNTRLKMEKLDNQDNIYSVKVMKSDTLINKVDANVNIQISEEGFE